MVRAIRGVLVTVEPAIKSLILHIDSGTNDIIIEDLDETHLLIKESMLPVLKKKLDERLKSTTVVPDSLSDSD
ncbi:hypothetical protein QBC47DRAFT_402918 [Echria macrotheca]|uniref:General transcription and DNA repair factor IIH subunit TFB5 n=1 Tax=Echria macrotheca TaxID=438768 RepID=A0AAJ0BAK1_9PEZI|nr:hypothetical protein QBC47DRAFT_402918 [Echria macrotheca]